MKKLTYPDYTVAPVVETIFIDGFQFEICEFKTESARDEFGIKKTSRFFLLTDGHFFNNEGLLNGASLIGNDVWSAYCTDRQFIKNLISEFETKLESIEKWQKRASIIKEGQYNLAQIIVDNIKSDLKIRYGVRV